MAYLFSSRIRIQLVSCNEDLVTLKNPTLCLNYAQLLQLLLLLLIYIWEIKDWDEAPVTQHMPGTEIKPQEVVSVVSVGGR